MSHDFKSHLLNGAKKLDISLTDTQCEQLLTYHELLIKWNKAYNLTAVRDPLAMVYRHLLDSLSIAPYLEGRRFLDVGTGAGFPGMVMAILYPERQWHLLDSNGKKTRFLFQVKLALTLDNVLIHNERLEQHQQKGYDGIVSRAFASLGFMASHCEPLLSPQGYCYAMKGLYPEQEIAELPSSIKLEKSIQLPLLDSSYEDPAASNRHLVILTKTQ